MTCSGIETNETVQYYERHADEFTQDTAAADVSNILNEFAALLPARAAVLDWGCGTGRDSRTMLGMGFSVTSIDASEAMCAKANALFNVDVRCEGFADLNTACEFDGIWACASLLHVRRSELPSILRIAHSALKQGGILYASFKQGDYEGMRTGRWYTDLEEDALFELAGEDFVIVRTWVTGDVRPGRSEEKWLNCLLRKRS